MGLFSKALPPYSGPYLVGTTNVEIPVTPQAFGTARLIKTKEPALLLETVLYTLYYPTSTKGPTQSHMQWLQRPVSTTIGGYSRFLGRSQWLLLPAFYLLAGSTRLPGWVDAPLADKHVQKELQEVEGKGPVQTTREGLGTTSGSEGTLVDTASGGGQDFPLVIFSHGLGGSRTTYSQYCGDLASRGYVVAAIEHRDGSGPISIVRLENGVERTVDYAKMEDLYFDAPNPTLEQIEFRKEQLLMRTAEVKEVLASLVRINRGEGGAIGGENRRVEKDSSVDLTSWKGRLGIDGKAIMTGHSFGGATTLQVLRAGSSFPFVRGICLDPWTEPIPPADSDADSPPSSSPEAGADSAVELGTAISVPLLVINSEAFTLWTPHYKVVREIVERVKSDAESWFVTLVGSIHLSFSDFPLIQPFIAKKAGARVDSQLAMSKFVEASIEFLGGHARDGEILSGKVIPGDENGTREGEGYKSRGGNPMETVGEMRMHVRPS